MRSSFVSQSFAQVVSSNGNSSVKTLELHSRDGAPLKGVYKEFKDGKQVKIKKINVAQPCTLKSTKDVALKSSTKKPKLLKDETSKRKTRKAM